MNVKAQKSIFIFVCFYFLIILHAFSSNVPLDSVGVEKRGNKTFVLHKVDPKETLFSISHRYKTKVELIETENPEVKSGLKVGAVIRVPYEVKVATEAVTHSSGNKTHTVGAGQALYSISRMYNVKVEDVKKWNNIENNEISVGQTIFVAPPTGVTTSLVTIKPAEQPVATKEEPKDVPNFRYDAKGNKVHITEPGQTLYSLARIYDISVEDIQKWNNMSGTEITTGREIIVERPKQQAIAATTPEKSNAEVTHTESSKVVHADTQRTVTVAKPSVPKANQPAPPEPVRSSNSTNFNKVIDRGLAELIEGSEDNPKFLALHKTAGVGTIIQVKNELNNLYIFARVIGKLPETTSNDKLIIKLSKKAYDKLGAVDKRFPVEVSYVPNN